MPIHRRRLLQVAGAGCALAALPTALTASTTALRVHQVQDSVALPVFAAGDLVVADTGVTQFAGAGLYLYPSWGQPRLYEVQAAGNRLEFRNPGSGLLLWTQSAGLEATFAGRLLDKPEAAALLVVYPSLTVPSLPVPA